MGLVYKARQLKLNRVVALKMIRSGSHPEEEERRRLLAEAIATIRHPGIVQIFDFGTHEGLPYFAFKFCERGSLAERLAGTPLEHQVQEVAQGEGGHRPPRPGAHQPGRQRERRHAKRREADR